MTIMKMHEASPALYDESPCTTDSDTSVGDILPVPEDKRCKYPSKYCGRARVRKSNGTFHRFCQYHRVKANTNQKRWTSVRRLQAAQEEQHRRRAQAVALGRQATPIKMEDALESWTPELLPDPVSLTQSPEPMGLRSEDVEILHALFLSDWPMPSMYPPHCHVYKLDALEHYDLAL